MTKKQENKYNIIINTNFIVSLLILIATSYAAFVIKTLQSNIHDLKCELQKQYQIIIQLAEKLEQTNIKLVAHLSWHNGKNK